MGNRTRSLKKAALLGSGAAILATAAVGIAALLGVSRLPIAEYLLFPGSMAAWAYKGDNYTSSAEFLRYTIAMGIPLNALAGAILGVLVAWIRHRLQMAGPADRE